MSEHTLNECICGNQPKMECYKAGGLYQAVCKKCGRRSVKSTISIGVLIDWNRQTAAPDLLKAVKLHMKFWDDMPKGQLGNLICDIGTLNDAFLRSSAAIVEAKSSS